MLCPHMSSELINILRGNILEGVSLGFGSGTPGSLMGLRCFAYCLQQRLENRDGKHLMKKNLGGEVSGETTGFCDL